MISEAAGHRKPEPEIFHAAAAVAGAALDGSWMIGDSAPADIRGALGVGARSVWVSAGRPAVDGTGLPAQPHHPGHRVRHPACDQHPDRRSKCGQTAAIWWRARARRHRRRPA
ncbi:HAD hydrolase-like protein [Streptomyces canus]